ncbi:unnamed protein product, partial [Iphiclides podalirius]
MLHGARAIPQKAYDAHTRGKERCVRERAYITPSESALTLGGRGVGEARTFLRGSGLALSVPAALRGRRGCARVTPREPRTPAHAHFHLANYS